MQAPADAEDADGRVADVDDETPVRGMPSLRPARWRERASRLGIAAHDNRLAKAESGWRPARLDVAKNHLLEPSSPWCIARRMQQGFTTGC